MKKLPLGVLFLFIIVTTFTIHTTSAENSKIKLQIKLIKYLTFDSDYLFCNADNYQYCGYRMSVEIKKKQTSPFKQTYKSPKGTYAKEIIFENNVIFFNLDYYPRELFVKITLRYYNTEKLLTVKEFAKQLDRIPFGYVRAKTEKLMDPYDVTNSEFMFSTWYECAYNFYGPVCSVECKGKQGETSCSAEGHELCLFVNSGHPPPCVESTTTTTASITTAAATTTTTNATFTTHTNNNSKNLVATSIPVRNSTSSKRISRMSHKTLTHIPTSASIRLSTTNSKTTSYVKSDPIPVKNDNVFELTINNKVLIIFFLIFLVAILFGCSATAVSTKIFKPQKKANISASCMSEICHDNHYYKALHDDCLSYKMSLLNGDTYRRSTSWDVDTTASIYEPLRKIGPTNAGLEPAVVEEVVYSQPNKRHPRYSVLTLPMKSSQRRGDARPPLPMRRCSCEVNDLHRSRSMEL